MEQAKRKKTLLTSGRKCKPSLRLIRALLITSQGWNWPLLPGDRSLRFGMIKELGLLSRFSWSKFCLGLTIGI